MLVSHSGTSEIRVARHTVPESDIRSFRVERGRILFIKCVQTLESVEQTGGTWLLSNADLLCADPLREQALVFSGDIIFD